MNELQAEDSFLYENAVKMLLDRFPEFKSSKEYDPNNEEFVYAVYAAFCSFLVNRINESSNAAADPLVIRAFNYFNEMLEHIDNYYWKELTYAGTFEYLLEYGEVIDLAKGLLSEEGKRWFNEAPRWFKTPLK